VLLLYKNRVVRLGLVQPVLGHVMQL
jgi:hypothetical protein